MFIELMFFQKQICLKLLIFTIMFKEDLLTNYTNEKTQPQNFVLLYVYINGRMYKTIFFLFKLKFVLIKKQWYSLVKNVQNSNQAICFLFNAQCIGHDIMSSHVTISVCKTSIGEGKCIIYFKTYMKHLTCGAVPLIPNSGLVNMALPFSATN